jgi:hypothetical protein
MSVIEKTCSYCCMTSWSSVGGSYYRTHVNRETRKEEKCDTKGTTFKDGVPQ